MNSVEKLITRVRELDAAATPGPWKEDGYNVVGPDRVGILTPLTLNPYAEWAVNARQLTAEYRSITPKLAVMLERALEELESVRKSSSYRIKQDAAEAIDEIEAMAE